MADVLRFQFTEGINEFSDRETFEVSKIIINGRELVDLVKEYETPYAKAEGHPEVAGQYAYLDTPSLHENLIDFKNQKTIEIFSGIPLLCCECRTEGCRDFTVKIHEEGNFIVWSNFSQPNKDRNWNYENFGEFYFDKDAYWAEVKKLLYPYGLNGTALPHSGKMSFTLTDQSRTRKVRNWSQIDNAIWNLKPVDDNYMILQPSEPIQGNVFLQATLPSTGYNVIHGYIVETRFEFGEAFQQFRTRITDFDELLKIFKAYYDYQSIPDLSAWKDISQAIADETADY